MDLTPGQKALLPFWGSIQSAVTQRVGTAELWDAVRQAASAEGVILRGVSATDMSGLRGLAAGQRNAGDNLARAGPGDVITGQMIGQDLSSRALADQALAPSWIVRFEQDLNISGELVTVWRSSVFDGSLPVTLSDLRNTLDADAEEMLTSYAGGIEAAPAVHIGIGRIQISAV